jgi:hypothetical protein
MRFQVVSQPSLDLVIVLVYYLHELNSLNLQLVVVTEFQGLVLVQQLNHFQQAAVVGQAQLPIGFIPSLNLPSTRARSN